MKSFRHLWAKKVAKKPDEVIKSDIFISIAGQSIVKLFILGHFFITQWMSEIRTSKNQTSLKSGRPVFGTMLDHFRISDVYCS